MNNKEDKTLEEIILEKYMYMLEGMFFILKGILCVVFNTVVTCAVIATNEFDGPYPYIFKIFGKTVALVVICIGAIMIHATIKFFIFVINKSLELEEKNTARYKMLVGKLIFWGAFTACICITFTSINYEFWLNVMKKVISIWHAKILSAILSSLPNLIYAIVLIRDYFNTKSFE